MDIFVCADKNESDEAAYSTAT